MEVSKHYIYRVTNNINGKTYIGQHRYYKSLLKNDWYYGSGKLIRKALSKYGKENFTKEIITIAMSQSEADVLERFYIEKERAKGKAEYNIQSGGKSGCKSSSHVAWNKGKHLSEEDKLHKSIAAKNRIDGNPGARGHKHTEEAKRRISEASRKRCGITPWNKGKHLSDEMKKKISEGTKLGMKKWRETNGINKRK